MTGVQKSNLESIIRNDGDCIAAVGFCSKEFCVMVEICTPLAAKSNRGIKFLIESNYYPEMYKAAIQIYEEEFGREELVEVLL